MEIVDILTPPTFEKSGTTKPVAQARTDGDWIGTFNLWIIKNEPVPSVVYQVRNPDALWAPGKLDVTAGGHYAAGEELYDGLREAKEELGREYAPEQLTYLGRKINVSPDTKGTVHHNVVDISLVLDNSALESYVLQKEEVYAICDCPVEELVRAHKDGAYSFSTIALTNSGEKEELSVSGDSFPYNWDNYHYKIALLAKRFLAGEKDLVY